MHCRRFSQRIHSFGVSLCLLVEGGDGGTPALGQSVLLEEPGQLACCACHGSLLRGALSCRSDGFAAAATVVVEGAGTAEQVTGVADVIATTIFLLCTPPYSCCAHSLVPSQSARDRSCLTFHCTSVGVGSMSWLESTQTCGS